MIDQELLALIRCPITNQPLKQASDDLVNRCNQGVTAGTLQDRGQRAVTEPIEQLLVTEDQQWGYPVRSEIPTLIPDWAIELAAMPAE